MVDGGDDFRYLLMVGIIRIYNNMRELTSLQVITSLMDSYQIWYVLESCYFVCMGIIAKLLHECKQNIMLHIRLATPMPLLSQIGLLCFPSVRQKVRQFKSQQKKEARLHIYYVCKPIDTNHRIRWLTPILLNNTNPSNPHII